MPRGYERVNLSGDADGEGHGVPMYPILAPRSDADGAIEIGANTTAAPSPSAPAHETHVHVTVVPAAASAAASPAAPVAVAPPTYSYAAPSGQLYYGESHGLYTPISDNQLVERAGAVAPASYAAPVSSSAMYPAPAYAYAYPPAPAPAPVAPAVYPSLPSGPSVAVPIVPRPAAGALPVAMPVAMPVGVPAGMAMAHAPVPVQPMQLVSMVPPVPPTTEHLKAALLNRRVEFDCNRYLREGWTFMKANFCAFFGALLFWGVFGTLLYVAVWALFVAIGAEPKPEWHRHGGRNNEWDDDYGYAWSWGTVIRNLLCQIMLFQPIVAGFMAAIFEAIRDNAHFKWRSTFAAFKCPYYVRLIGLNLVVGGLTRLLSLLFFFPGVWFAIASLFALPLHYDNRHIPLRVWPAIKLSINTIMRSFCSFFGFLIVCVLINVVGFLAFGVGLLVSLPFTAAAACYCYHHHVGINGAPVVVTPETAAQMAHTHAAVTAQLARPIVAPIAVASPVAPHVVVVNAAAPAPAGVYPAHA